MWSIGFYRAFEGLGLRQGLDPEVQGFHPVSLRAGSAVAQEMLCRLGQDSREKKKPLLCLRIRVRG